MEPEQRYQITDTIAAGEFATVYRARDLELAREVAIKQIHYQYMQDPRQLDRYWQEAQILANLHHQYIMTIYDIVRERGWLILELMRGSLAGELQGRPIDVETLKIALVQSLHALDFLHSRGVLHGDVKPSNLLIGLNNRLKLGDFGLARRSGGGEGSLLKGTPKYMAPEVMSDHFGPVGPASDLYSLGFTCYELLCGANFESLFPGLNSFGRDKAVAWMMWHAAPDRRLPEIAKVLEGVPESIAAVIQKLILKEPAQRYRTAAAALEDLKERPITPVSPGADAEAVAAAAEAKRKRRLAIGAFAASAALSLALALLPLGREQPAPEAPSSAAADARRGRIRDLLLDEQKIVFVAPEDRQPLEIAVPPDCKIQLNGEQFLLLRELKSGDEVEVALAKDKSQQLTATAIQVVRPEVLEGLFNSTEQQLSVLKLDVTPDGKEREIRLLHVPPDLKPLLNGQREFEGRSVTLAMLQPGDRISAAYFLHGSERDAVSIEAYRVVTLSGKLLRLNLEQRQLEITADGRERKFPLAADCEITLNGDFASLRDLAPGDEATIQHDAEVKRIDAKRSAKSAR
ncbi:MAG TPA: serine/threonine-protein kinase [Pirellulales bacterium]|nr:serine/threonine-protein kinase [Pirellulales bacterium]